MNIEQYRELKEREANQTQEPVVVEEQPEVVETIQEETIQEEPIQEQPTKVLVGDEEVDIEELKNGYLRQSDYTRKTQEVSRQKLEAQDAIAFYEHLKQNPQAIEQLLNTTGVPKQLDPTESKVIELENKLYDIMLEKEIESLQSKYDDFEVMNVLNIASEKGLTNLEDAYHLSKTNKPQGQINTDSIKEQLRKEILLELQNEANSTKTIISTPGTSAQPESTLPTISSAEIKVAKMMKMSEQDYITWRDANK